MKSHLNFIIAILQINIIISAYPPLEKCKLSDGDCLKSSAQKALQPFVAGVPELETNVLDVMNINRLNIELAGLKLVMTNSTLKGLKQSTIEKIKFNTKKNELQIDVTIQNLVLKGHYVASGRLLILPIHGDGILTIKMKKLIVEASMPYEIIKNNGGDDVINLKSFKFKFDVQENVNFHLTNLFNGNKELSDAMHFFINENWKQVAEEFGRPIIQAAYVIIFDSLKKFMGQPLREITLE